MLEILGHHFLGNAPAHEVEVAFAFESLLQTHLGAECFARILLRPACGGIEANLIVGSILRGVVEVLDVCAVHGTLAHAVDELAGSVEVFAQFNQRLSLVEQEVGVADNLPVEARGTPRPASEHVGRFGRNPEALGAVVTIDTAVAHPRLAGRFLVRLKGNRGAANDEVKARVNGGRCVAERLVLLIHERHYAIVGARLIVEDGEARCVGLIGIDEVLGGEEETITMVRAVAARGVEQVAPVDTACVTRAIVHGILHGEDRLHAILVGDEVQLLEVAQQVVALHLVNEVDHFAEQVLVNILDGMRFGVLLVGLIEFHLGSIGQGDIAVDASHLRLSFGQMVGSIKQFAGDACEMFLAGVFIVGHVDVFRGGEILVDIGHLVEEAYEFKVVVCAQHLHLGR